MWELENINCNNNIHTSWIDIINAPYGFVEAKATTPLLCCPVLKRETCRLRNNPWYAIIFISGNCSTLIINQTLTLCSYSFVSPIQSSPFIDIHRNGQSVATCSSVEPRMATTKKFPIFNIFQSTLFKFIFNSLNCSFTKVMHPGWNAVISLKK